MPVRLLGVPIAAAAPRLRRHEPLRAHARAAVRLEENEAPVGLTDHVESENVPRRAKVFL